MSQQSELSYPVRAVPILKYFGQLCLVVSLLTIVPFIFTLFFQEFEFSGVYAGIILCTGVFGAFLSRLEAPENLQVNEALVLVVMIFLFAPLVMTAPFMMSGLTFADALFETISGATTTGLSMIEDVDSVPYSTLLARSWMQWYGGLGIVAFSLVLLLSSGKVTRTLIKSEIESKDLIGGTKAHVHRILKVYLLFTFIGIGGLLIFQVPVKDAFSLIFASVSTGGFSPYNDSLKTLGLAVQYFIIIVCILCAVSLPFYHRLYREKWKMTVDTIQFIGLLCCGLAVMAILWFFLPLAEAVSVPILAFSAQTTTGFSNSDVSLFDPASKLIVILSMYIGGGIGSTAGGIKIIRLLIMLKVIATIVKGTSLTPHAAQETKFFREKITIEEQRNAVTVILLFASLIFLSWIPFAAMGYDPLDSLFEVVSATGTVGLSTGITSPQLPLFLKGVLCADMYLGRLEMLPWLVLAGRSTWIGTRMGGV